MLPTDQRYLDLTEDQIEMLFLAFIDRPTDQEVLHHYRRGKQTDRMKVPTSVLEKFGYSPDQISQITEDFAHTLGG